MSGRSGVPVGTRHRPTAPEAGREVENRHRSSRSAVAASSRLLRSHVTGATQHHRLPVATDYRRCMVRRKPLAAGASRGARHPPCVSARRPPPRDAKELKPGDLDGASLIPPAQAKVRRPSSDPPPLSGALRGRYARASSADRPDRQKSRRPADRPGGRPVRNRERPERRPPPSPCARNGQRARSGRCGSHGAVESPPLEAERPESSARLTIFNQFNCSGAACLWRRCHGEQRVEAETRQGLARSSSDSCLSCWRRLIDGNRRPRTVESASPIPRDQEAHPAPRRSARCRPAPRRPGCAATSDSGRRRLGGVDHRPGWAGRVGRGRASVRPLTAGARRATALKGAESADADDDTVIGAARHCDQTIDLVVAAFAAEALHREGDRAGRAKGAATAPATAGSTRSPGR